MLRFKNNFIFDIQEYQADVEDDPDEEDMDDVNRDNGRERHWRMVSEENDGGVDDKK